MPAYLGLFAILAVWAFLVLRRGAPLRTYAIIYGINTLIALVAEGLFCLVLHRYTFGGYGGFIVTTLGIEPLLGILYAHYSYRRPVLRAIAGAIILGCVMELMFLQLNVFRYERGWSPFLTTACFTLYFLWTRWLRQLAGRVDEIAPPGLPG